MDGDDTRRVIEIARDAELAMEAARMAAKVGGSKTDAEAAALKILSRSFTSNKSVPSACTLSPSSDDSLSTPTDSLLVAKSQATICAALALAKTFDQDHDGEKALTRSTSLPDIIETTRRTKRVMYPFTPLSKPLPPFTRPACRRDPSGSHAGFLPPTTNNDDSSSPTSATEVYSGSASISVLSDGVSTGASSAGSTIMKLERKESKDPSGSKSKLQLSASKSTIQADDSIAVSFATRDPEACEISKIKKEPRLTRLRIQSGNKSWVAKGFRAVEPPAHARSYFANNFARYQELNSEADYLKDQHKRIVSVCIPCFNEDASALQRTIHSLRRSYLPPRFVLEILVVVDGKQQISPSMVKFLQKTFGIVVTEEDPRKNPFVTFPEAQTIVVENVSNGDAREPLTLVIKRMNKRKVNSQKWWLYGHARDVGAEFIFATDCGIVFDRKCILILLERMMRQPNCQGLTGYQRVMPAKMQGDSSFEPCVDPMGFFLRQLQSFDFEMSQSTTKSLVDSLGFVPVLPGPCSLFRYDAFLRVSKEYFQLTTMALRGDSSDIVLGNVQLAEDRFPPVLLSFGSEEDAGLLSDFGEPDDDLIEDSTGKKHSVTGFERDAIFYFEAEKPLGQLVRQRRRWINGAYMAAYWALRGGWIKRSKQGMLFKIGAAAVLMFEIMQGAMIRLIIPATLSCGLFFMVTIIPSIYEGDADEVMARMGGHNSDPLLFLYGCIAAGIYMGGFLVFMIAHTPRAVPNEASLPGEEVTYHIETESAYRPWVFAMSYLLNLIMTFMFLYVGYGVYDLIGWSDSPLYFRMLTVLIGFPYMVALLDGIINSARPSFKAFVNLILLTPVFLSASIWFYVWFPCYASARISDLSWGNRAAHQDSSTSIIARHRAYLGRVVSVSIVLCNVLLTIGIIFIMNWVEKFLTAVLFTLLGLNILLHVVNLMDMLWRFFSHTIIYWLYGVPPPPLNLRAANADDEDDAAEQQFDDEFSEGSQDYEVFFYAVDADAEDPRDTELSF